MAPAAGEAKAAVAAAARGEAASLTRGPHSTMVPYGTGTRVPWCMVAHKPVAQALRSEASAEISEAEQLTRAAAAGRQAAHESNS